MSEAIRCDRCGQYFDQRVKTDLKVEGGKFIMVFSFLRPLTGEEVAAYKERQQSNPVVQFFESDTPKYQHQDLCEPCQKELIYQGLTEIIKQAKTINKWDNVLKEIQK